MLMMETDSWKLTNILGSGVMVVVLWRWCADDPFNIPYSAFIGP